MDDKQNGIGPWCVSYAMLKRKWIPLKNTEKPTDQTSLLCWFDTWGSLILYNLNQMWCYTASKFSKHCHSSLTTNQNKTKKIGGGIIASL